MLREFIRYGKGHPNKFVSYTKNMLLYGSDAGWRPRDYGHIVTCEVGNRITAYVHLFTGREMGHGAYKVDLGRYPFRIVPVSHH